jgi:hypothetical protein
MTSRTGSTMTLAAFEHLLDVYGADRTRWPLAERAGAASLLLSNASARRRLMEAAALDDLLQRIPDPSEGDVQVLTDRILAAATQGLSKPAIYVPHQHLNIAQAPAPQFYRSQTWRAASLLAASLIVGAFLGQSQLGAHALPAVEQLTGIVLPGSSAQQLALADLRFDSSDEDWN